MKVTNGILVTIIIEIIKGENNEKNYTDNINGFKRNFD